MKRIIIEMDDEISDDILTETKEYLQEMHEEDIASGKIKITEEK